MFTINDVLTATLTLFPTAVISGNEVLLDSSQEDGIVLTEIDDGWGFLHFNGMSFDFEDGDMDELIDAIKSATKNVVV